MRVLGGPAQKAIVERAILDAAPDVTSLEVEGTDDTVVGFVRSIAAGSAAVATECRRACKDEGDA